MSGVISLFLLASGVGCDKGSSDSAGEESDADTDTDTDTDTDVDEVATIDGTVHLTVMDPTGKKTLCDTMIAFTGGEGSGACLQCDYQFDISTEIVSENGSDCNYDAYPVASLYEGTTYFDQWIGLTESYAVTGGSLDNLVWWGFGVDYGGGAVYPGPYWSVLGYEGASYYIGTSYSAGLLSWSFADTSYLGDLLNVTTCGDRSSYAYSGYWAYWSDSYYVGSPNYYGNYTGVGSLNCAYNKPYERWSFYGVDDTYAYVSVDTIAAATAFDPEFRVSTDDTCMVARGDENFECSYAAESNFWCSSVKFPTTKGEHYTITVQPWWGDGDCDGETGDYILYVDTSSDPALTRGKSGELWPLEATVSSEVESTITVTKQ